MPRLNKLQAFLNRCPEQLRKELISRILSAENSKVAYLHLKSIGCKASYDSVTNWRNAHRRQAGSSANPTNESEDRFNSSMPKSGAEGIQESYKLAMKLNVLVDKLTDLLLSHQWIEGDETKLSNRDALKILGALAGLSRAGIGSVSDLTLQKVYDNQRMLMLAQVAEVMEAARSIYQNVSPEVLPIVKAACDLVEAKQNLKLESLLDVTTKP